MPEIPYIPDHAPFTEEQRLWLNGYLAGLFSDATRSAQALAGLGGAPGGTKPPSQPLVVLYGSQTGTAEAIARKVNAEATKRGFAPRLVDLAKFDSVDLSKESNALLITSTYGDGEPPDNAQGFWSFLSGDGAPRLEQLRYSVLALGDTNYPAFCQFGINCDQRLAALGATPIHPRTDCDVDYESPAKAWTDGVFNALLEGAAPSVSPLAQESEKPTQILIPGSSRKAPFLARLLSSRTLNAAGSSKDVRHCEISLAGSGLHYEVGDALGVFPTNCPELVADLLALIHCDGEEAVRTAEGEELPLRLALLQHYDINRPSADFLKAAAARATASEWPALLEPSRQAELKAFLWGREIIDLLRDLEVPFSAQVLVGLLKKLQPRLYSISSSLAAHPEEVHLTIGTVRYESHGRTRKGVCSTFLAERATSDTPLPVFIQRSHGFKLPADGNVPIIMVGPGTGIAPFRAFLEERQIRGATGRNWLFFGDQRQASDFLYRETLEGWLKDGHLTRLDLAFSRDQDAKVYVQHRMIEAAAELWMWLEAGAHFYVCGDASRMAKDVDEALHQVVSTAGGLSTEAAAAYLKALKSTQRYQRDVY